MYRFAHLIAVLLIGSVAAVPSTYGQTYEYCGFDAEQQGALTQLGGYHITATGTVKALLIFIDFPDDTVDTYNSTWPVGVGPNFLDDIVDTDENQNSGLQYNLTTFFRDMSFDQFTMIGEAYYVQAPESLSWYVQNHTGEEAAYAARDAIEILDGGVDFEDFDRWEYQGPYTHAEGTDGNLDIVFICFRRWYLCNRIFECSFLAEGWYGASLPDYFVSVDGGERNIISLQAVDVLQMMQYPRLEHLVHEFGHVWGLPHNYSGGLWSLMGHRGPNVSYFMNSFEREQLGWISFTDVTTDGQTASIADFGDDAVAYRIALPNTNPQEYFLVENHQLISNYDVVDLTGGAGLYILHDNGVRHVEANNLRVVAADGRWNWSNPYWIHNPWSINPEDSIPVYKREAISRAQGYTDKVLIPHTKNGSGLMHAWLDEQTEQLATPAARFKGDGKDRWTYLENNMFSPWSGYAAYDWVGTSATTIGVEITGTSGSNINTKFYTQNPINGPPSKPMDLHLSLVDAGEYKYNVRLTWAAILEDDVNPSGYILIERRIRDQGYAWTAWTEVASVNGDETEWTDYEVTYWGGDAGDSLQYRLRTKDTDNNYSVYSDIATLVGSVQSDYGKISMTPGLPSEFELQQNYPNPFNPTTVIKYQLAEDALVVLKVFDVLGRDVATLVNQHQSAGYYSVVLDGQTFSSGVYLARIMAKGPLGNILFSKSTKLLLVK